MKRSPLRRSAKGLMRRVPLRNRGSKTRRDEIEMAEAEKEMGLPICRLAIMEQNRLDLPRHLCIGRLQRHHVLPRRKGGSNHPSNLIWLCGWAHDWVHNQDPVRARALGLLK